MHTRTRGSAARALAGALLALPLTAQAEYGLNMPVGVTPISRDVYDLHMLIYWICVAIGVVVFGAIFWSILMHRKSKGAVAAQFHESTGVEIAWTVVPFLILVAMAVPATQTLIDMEDTSNADLTIKVTGYQWKWRYDYMDDGFGFYSNMSTPRAQIENAEAKSENYLLEVDNPIVVPVGKKVRFLITANDVLHAWWVPALGMKRDAIPGFINEMWARVEEPGIYRGQCTELCGKDHGFMPVVLEAKNETDYAAWLADQKVAMAGEAADSEREWSREDLMSKGEQVYNTQCAACHGPTGQGMPNIFPALAGSAIATGDLAAHLDIVLKGKPGTAMAAFGQQLSDADIAAVVTYERNAFGNETGDTVQPAQVAAAR